MSECVVLIALAKILDVKKMRFQLALNKTFCLTPQPLTYSRLKHRQRKKFNKTMLSAPPPPSSVFHTKLTISELKSK